MSTFVFAVAVQRPAVLILLGLLIAVSGCTVPQRTITPQRLEHGIIYVLPGIEGVSVWNRDIVAGLEQGGVTSAIEIHDWTVGVQGALINLTDIERNRRQAARLAEKIIAYREQHPGRPVHLVGHSGGAGMAVMTLEALPAGRQIDAAILLAPALSPEYDLSIALRRVRQGIWSFYSPRDVTLLKLGTTVFGPIDRTRGAAAGAVGFAIPAGLDRDSRRLYQQRLRQIRWSKRLEAYGASGSHVGWTDTDFVANYIAPLVREIESARPLSPGAVGEEAEDDGRNNPESDRPISE